MILEIGSVLVQIPRYCCSFSSETFNRLKKKKKEERVSLRISTAFLCLQVSSKHEAASGAALISPVYHAHPLFFFFLFLSCLPNLEHLLGQLSKSLRFLPDTTTYVFQVELLRSASITVEPIDTKDRAVYSPVNRLRKKYLLRTVFSEGKFSNYHKFLQRDKPRQTPFSPFLRNNSLVFRGSEKEGGRKK